MIGRNMLQLVSFRGKEVTLGRRKKENIVAIALSYTPSTPFVVGSDCLGEREIVQEPESTQ